MIKVLDSISNVTSTILLWLAGTALTGMMLLACSNMVLRAVSAPIKGSYELMGFMGALVVAFGLAATQRTKGHIALTILAGLFPSGVERAIDLVTHLCAAVFFALVGWRTSVYAHTLFTSGEVSETLRIAHYPFVLAVALGCFAISLALVCDFLKACAPARSGLERGAK